MDIRTIPLSELEADPLGTLNACAVSGTPLVIELPNQRLVAVHALDQSEDDSLTSDLLESNAAFKALVAKSKASPRAPFNPSR
jgi:hypothetical protein